MRGLINVMKVGLGLYMLSPIYNQSEDEEIGISSTLTGSTLLVNGTYCLIRDSKKIVEDLGYYLSKYAKHYIKGPNVSDIVIACLGESAIQSLDGIMTDCGNDIIDTCSLFLRICDRTHNSQQSEGFYLESHAHNKIVGCTEPSIDEQ